MDKKILEIFNLCQRLAALLRDKETITNLKELYKRHPEMFENTKKVSYRLEEIVGKTENKARNKKLSKESTNIHKH